MAQKLKNFTDAKDSRSRHQWSKWFDGNIWRLTRGEDFAARLESFRNMAYGQAKRDGGSVEIRVVDDATLELRFKPKVPA